jgi:hypothetical protein
MMSCSAEAEITLLLSFGPPMSDVQTTSSLLSLAHRGASACTVVIGFTVSTLNEELCAQCGKVSGTCDCFFDNGEPIEFPCRIAHGGNVFDPSPAIQVQTMLFSHFIVWMILTETFPTSSKTF